jgi:hypothetical protein
MKHMACDRTEQYSNTFSRSPPIAPLLKHLSENRDALMHLQVIVFAMKKGEKMSLNRRLAIANGVIWFVILSTSLACETVEEPAASQPQPVVTTDAQMLKTERVSGEVKETMPGPKLVLGVRWEGIGRKSAVTSDEIHLVVENFTDIDLDVSVQVISTGLLKYEETLNLGKLMLAPNEERVFQISAKDLPVQVSVGVGQLLADVRAMVPKSTGMVEWRAPVQPVYFQHNADFRAMETFEETIVTLSSGSRFPGQRTRRRFEAAV